MQQWVVMLCKNKKILQYSICRGDKQSWAGWLKPWGLSAVMLYRCNISPGLGIKAGQNSGQHWTHHFRQLPGSVLPFQTPSVTAAASLWDLLASSASIWPSQMVLQVKNGYEFFADIQNGASGLGARFFIASPEPSKALLVPPKEIESGTVSFPYQTSPRTDCSNVLARSHWIEALDAYRNQGPFLQAFQEALDLCKPRKIKREEVGKITEADLRQIFTDGESLKLPSSGVGYWDPIDLFQEVKHLGQNHASRYMATWHSIQMRAHIRLAAGTNCFSHVNIASSYWIRRPYWNALNFLEASMRNSWLLTWHPVHETSLRSSIPVNKPQHWTTRPGSMIRMQRFQVWNFPSCLKWRPT